MIYTYACCYSFVWSFRDRVRALAHSPHTPYNPVQLKQQQKCRMIVGAPCMYTYAHFELESIYICLSLNQMKYFNHIAEKWVSVYMSLPQWGNCSFYLFFKFSIGYVSRIIGATHYSLSINSQCCKVVFNLRSFKLNWFRDAILINHLWTFYNKRFPPKKICLAYSTEKH